VHNGVVTVSDDPVKQAEQILSAATLEHLRNMLAGTGVSAACLVVKMDDNRLRMATAGCDSTEAIGILHVGIDALVEEVRG
jgi:hypothetical protein